MAPKATTEEVHILKVRNNRTSIKITWKQGADTYSVTFHDNPLPSFYNALKALKTHVCALCEFPARDAEKLDPSGITIVSPEEDSPQALIVAKKHIKRNKRVFNIATPMLSMYESDDPDSPKVDHMSTEEAAAIEKVIKEAKRYIAGDRAQGQIQLEDEPDEKKDDSHQEKIPGVDA